MIKTMLMALLLAAAPAPEPVTLSPAQFAAALQGIVGQRYEGGVTIARIFAEDRILVIVFDGPAGWRAALTPEQIAAIFTGSFCEDSDFDYFVNGNTIRIDSIEAGAGLRTGPIIRHCG
jgi:hypothetical protein